MLCSNEQRDEHERVPLEQQKDDDQLTTDRTGSRLHGSVLCADQTTAHTQCVDQMASWMRYTRTVSGSGGYVEMQQSMVLW